MCDSLNYVDCKFWYTGVNLWCFRLESTNSLYLMCLHFVARVRQYWHCSCHYGYIFNPKLVCYQTCLQAVSRDRNLLCVPSHKLNFGARSFRVASPTVWNSLPADIRACIFYGSFIRQLKTFFLIMLFYLYVVRP